jgi:hypothetical protein
MGEGYDEISEKVLDKEIGDQTIPYTSGEQWNNSGCLPCGIVFNRMKAYHEADMVRLMFEIGRLNRKVRKLEEGYAVLMHLEKQLNKQGYGKVRTARKVQGGELQRGAVQPEIPSKHETDMLDVPPRH